MWTVIDICTFSSSSMLFVIFFIFFFSFMVFHFFRCSNIWHTCPRSKENAPYLLPGFAHKLKWTSKPFFFLAYFYFFRVYWDKTVLLSFLVNMLNLHKVLSWFDKVWSWYEVAVNWISWRPARISQRPLKLSFDRKIPSYLKFFKQVL